MFRRRECPHSAGSTPLAPGVPRPHLVAGHLPSPWPPPEGGGSRRLSGLGCRRLRCGLFCIESFVGGTLCRRFRRGTWDCRSAAAWPYARSSNPSWGGCPGRTETWPPSTLPLAPSRKEGEAEQSYTSSRTPDASSTTNKMFVSWKPWKRSGVR